MFGKSDNKDSDWNEGTSAGADADGCAGDDGGEADGDGGQGGGHWKLQQRRVLLGQAEAGPGAVDQHAVRDEGEQMRQAIGDRLVDEV